MAGFTAGLIAGCLLGVSGTFVLLLLSVSLSERRGAAWNGHWLRDLSFAAVTLFAAGGVCYVLKLDKDSAILVLLFSVIAFARKGGIVTGIVGAALAAMILCVLFFPPVGSLMIRTSSDRLALALFLLIATLGARLVGGPRKVSS